MAALELKCGYIKVKIAKRKRRLHSHGPNAKTN
jgi:hypothetical protein